MRIANATSLFLPPSPPPSPSISVKCKYRNSRDYCLRRVFLPAVSVLLFFCGGGGGGAGGGCAQVPVLHVRRAEKLPVPSFLPAILPLRRTLPDWNRGRGHDHGGCSPGSKGMCVTSMTFSTLCA